MGIACGSQVIFCDLPVRLDTYTGCSHGCRYCFVKSKKDITVIKPEHCASHLKNFINGQRSGEVAWCDWNIPLHWGGGKRSVSTHRAKAQGQLGVPAGFRRNKLSFCVLNERKARCRPRISRLDSGMPMRCTGFYRLPEIRCSGAGGTVLRRTAHDVRSSGEKHPSCRCESAALYA